MKNIIKYTLIIIAVLLFSLSVQSTIETHYYTKEGIVGIVVQVTNEEVIILDNTGNGWIFEGKSSLHKGDYVIMKMFNTNNDNTIYE